MTQIKNGAVCLVALSVILLVGCQKSPGDQGTIVTATPQPSGMKNSASNVPGNIPPEAQERMRKWQVEKDAQLKKQNDVMTARIEKKN